MPRRIRDVSVAAVFLSAALVCFAKADMADVIYLNGPVVTMSDDLGVAEALAVREGRIAAVGDEAALRSAHQGEDTRLIDLNGQALLPGFIDAHGHFLQMGLMATAANLMPSPDAGVDDIDALLAALNRQVSAPLTGGLGLVLGLGYDDLQLAEQRHPTLTDLAAVETELPILIVHQSSHLGVANQAALDLAGVPDDVGDPVGGRYHRDADGNLTGVIEESAFFAVAGKLLATAELDLLLDRARAAQAVYVAAGFTTAQEGRADATAIETIARAAAEGLLEIDVAVYPDPTLALSEEGFVSDVMEAHAPTYTDHVRIAGIKLTLDGAVQRKAAWLTRPYLQPPEGQPETYSGYLQMPENVLGKWVGTAFQEGWQVLTDVNGDAALDQFLNAIEAANVALGEGDRRSVALHAQVTRHDQLERMKALGVIPSFMTVHTFYWGDALRDTVLGPERAARLSPQADALALDILFTSHNDAPVTPPSPQRMLYAQVTRMTRSGQVLGPDQRISIYEALKAITINAAYQQFEERQKGSLEVGKLADMVILDRNPLDMPAAELLELKVVETIKEGETVYRAAE